MDFYNVSGVAVLNGTVFSFRVATLSHTWGTLLISALALFTILLAVLFNNITKIVYKDEDNLDLAFDAGGKVSVGLTASTVVSQWTWAATLLQSSSVGVKYGICGPFWYAAGATVQILLFSCISVKLKILAPGAKTFLQFVRWRFGLGAHKVYCFYAFMTNIVVTAMLMLGGAEVLNLLISDYSIEMTIMMLTAMIGSYTMVGGLGATFYACYFNTATVFVGILIFVYRVFINYHSGLGTNLRGMFDKIMTLQAPEGNLNGSYLTLYSTGGLMFGVINIIGNFGTVFMDQSYWQSAVAAKPRDGVLGFLAGGVIWFAVPFTFALTMTVAYFVIQTDYQQPLLSTEQIDSGMVPLAVASCLGNGSEVVMLIMIMMAVTSTGSAEIIAVGSIMVYDIYMVYIKPFRSSRTPNSCILCGRSRGRMATTVDSCDCKRMSNCSVCKLDTENRQQVKRAVPPNYTCNTHGKYREYQDILSRKKNWCLLFITASIIPLSLTLRAVKVSLGWVYLFMGILIGSSVVPVSLSMFSNQISSLAMILSPPLGTTAALISWLVVASTYDGGLHQFLHNTGRDEAMLVGNLVSLVVGGVVCVIVSAVQSRRLSCKDREEIWESTLDIDNPLYPWAEVYAKEFKLFTPLTGLNARPALIDIVQRFKSVKMVAMVGSGLGTAIFLLLWPTIGLQEKSLSYESFSTWVYVAIVWTLMGGTTIIVLPLAGEIRRIRNDYLLSNVAVHHQHQQHQPITDEEML